MTITTTFNKDLMALRDVKSMADILDRLLEYQKIILDERPEAHFGSKAIWSQSVEKFFWKFYNATSDIEQGWKKS